jgi:hypothetical protein
VSCQMGGYCARQVCFRDDTGGLLRVRGCVAKGKGVLWRVCGGLSRHGCIVGGQASLSLPLSLPPSLPLSLSLSLRSSCTGPVYAKQLSIGTGLQSHEAYVSFARGPQETFVRGHSFHIFQALEPASSGRIRKPGKKFYKNHLCGCPPHMPTWVRPSDSNHRWFTASHTKSTD